MSSVTRDQEKRMQTTNIPAAMVLAGWGLFAASLMLPSWRIEGQVLARGDWPGYLCAYWIYPAWIPNLALALAPLLYFIRFKHLGPIGAWVALIWAVVVVAWELTAKGNSPLAGCYLWLSAFLLVALGHSIRKRYEQKTERP
jgi:hypothetical protein